MMMLSRALSKAIGRLLIGVLLFAQLAVASYACPSLPGTASMAEASPEMAMVATAAPENANAPESADMPPGCELSDQDAANLCAEHCHFGQQSAHTALAPVVHATIPTLLYLLPVEPAHMPGSGRSFPAPDANLAAAHPPPHAILHCVLRI